jgi:hypothetical protein
MTRKQIIETMARAIVIDRNGANCLPWSRLPAPWTPCQFLGYSREGV